MINEKKVEELRIKLKGFGFATTPLWMKEAMYEKAESTGDDIANQLRELADEVVGECRLNRHRADFLLMVAANRFEEAYLEWLERQNQRLQAQLAIFNS